MKKICKNCAFAGAKTPFTYYCHNYGTWIVDDESECKEFFGVDDYHRKLHDDNPENDS